MRKSAVIDVVGGVLKHERVNVDGFTALLRLIRLLCHHAIA